MCRKMALKRDIFALLTANFLLDYIPGWNVYFMCNPSLLNTENKQWDDWPTSLKQCTVQVIK